MSTLEQTVKPSLSVVIASCVGPPFITKCLESLHDQRESIEVIVVDRAGETVASSIERNFPWVEVIRRPPGESIPDLRRHGVLRAQGDYVAILEEHCVAGPDWVSTLFRCMEQGASVVSGPVAHANYTRLMDWVVYFTEYNSYMPPFERGQTSNVCGANCAYRRALLLQHMPSQGSGYWEADLNNRLLGSGHQFSMEPELVVYHTGPFGFQYYLWQRFLFSRAFAATRQAHLNLIQKATYLLGAPFLVPLLLVRIGARVLTKGHRVGRFVAGLPILVPVAVVYVAGEWVGLTMGPGDSLSKIE